MQNNTVVRDEAYHEAVIDYNDRMADAAKKVRNETKHPVVAGWAHSVFEQHRAHSEKHRRQLRAMRRQNASQTSISSTTIIEEK